MLIQSWQDEIKSLDSGKLGDIRDAFSHLYDWKLFRQEYTWTGLFTLGELVKQELELRNMQVLKRLTDEKGFSK